MTCIPAFTRACPSLAPVFVRRFLPAGAGIVRRFFQMTADHASCLICFDSRVVRRLADLSRSRVRVVMPLLSGLVRTARR